MKILVVEDYAPLRKSVERGLSEAGYAVEVAADGEDGLWALREGDYDAVVLDIMLPKMDGLTILRKLRAEGSPTPVLVLTAKDSLEDRVHGLNLGADDYLVKPFAFEELLARIRSLVRRRYEKRSPILRVGDLEIDTKARKVRRGRSHVPLSAREFAILEFLALRAGQVVTRSEIWEHVYDFASEPNSNTIDVYVGYLRRKLEHGGLPRLIHTRRGLGYELSEPESS